MLVGFLAVAAIAVAVTLVIRKLDSKPSQGEPSKSANTDSTHQGTEQK